MVKDFKAAAAASGPRDFKQGAPGGGFKKSFGGNAGGNRDGPRGNFGGRGGYN